MKNEYDLNLLEWIRFVQRKYINEEVMYYPEKKANIRINTKGGLFLDNGSRIEAYEENILWEWLYLNFSLK